MPNRKVSYVFVGILFTSCLLIPLNVSADSSSLPTCTPSFTLRLIDKSYDVPSQPTSTTNSHGEKTNITIPEFHVTDYEIEIKIQNVQYPRTIDGDPADLFYKVQTNGTTNYPWTSTSEYKASNSEYTIIYLDAAYPVDSIVDFKVAAVIRTSHSELGEYIPWLHDEAPRGLITTYQDYGSPWSPTQTFTMPDLSTLSLNPYEELSSASSFTPSFTINLVDKSYNVPDQTVSTTDPYNGSVTTSTIPGYHVKNFEFEVKIKNGLNNNVYYNLRTKGFYEDYWKESTNHKASDSNYTIVYLPANYRAGDKIDIQVQTETNAQESYWSPTQTVTMPDTEFAKSTSNITEPTELIIGTELIVGIIVTTISVLAATVILKRKTNQKQT